MIKLYVDTATSFHWNGMEVGLRLPVVDEMEEITRARDAFFTSVTDENPAGDQVLLLKYQYLVGSKLACDPSDARNPWFALTAEEATRMNKNLATQLPAPFFALALEKFNVMIARAQLDDEGRARFDAEMAKAKEEAAKSEADPPQAPSTEPSGTEAIPTAPSSDASLSESPDTSSVLPNSSGENATTAS